jgi:hypothetical protein
MSGAIISLPQSTFTQVLSVKQHDYYREHRKKDMLDDIANKTNADDYRNAATVVHKKFKLAYNIIARREHCLLAHPVKNYKQNGLQN